MFNLQPPQDDGLVIPKVESWSANKHYFLRRYIDAFTIAMRRKAWDSLHYVDLFAGAGLEEIEGQGLDWGSPLIAAQSPAQFARLHLCEHSRTKCDALAHRLAAFPQPAPPQVICGDANAAVAEVVRELPAGSLSMAFLDPYGLHLHFETLRQLASRRVDFIIFFPDHLDALRNWKIYSAKPDSHLDRVLNGRQWLGRLEESPPDRWAEVLGTVYTEQIRTLGYEHFDFERIARPDGRYLYRLIFCSRSPAGGDIWAGIARQKADGQHTFDF